MVEARDIADFLGVPLQGASVRVERPASIDQVRAGTLVFASGFRADYLQSLNACPDALALVTAEYAGLRSPHLVVGRPRLAFAQVLRQFFEPKPEASIAASARISPSACIGQGVAIGEYAVIGADVEIGAGTTIGHHVVLGAGTKVGKHCVIKSHCVIGEKGFGMEVDDEGHPIPIPHFGHVVLGDHVELGAFNTVVRGTLDATIVEDHVKTDDHVHIAHNVTVGADTQIAACAEISGSVSIGRGVWLAPNCSIVDKVSVGDRAMVGIGAVVTKPVPANTIVAGNPARAVGPRFKTAQAS